MNSKKILLHIPYISQINGMGANGVMNDCGPACCWMLLKGYGKLENKESVNSLYRSVVKNSDRFTSWMENIKIMRSHKLYPIYRSAMKALDIEYSIKNGYAVMALINYGVLNQFVDSYSSFSGNHFLLIVGMDDDAFILHDPLWLGDDGKHWHVQKDVFEKAWLYAEGVQGSGLMMTEQLEKIEKVSASGIVISSIGVNLRLGSGIEHSIVGRLYYNDDVLFGEIVTLRNGSIWGRLVNSKVWCAIEYGGSKLIFIEDDSKLLEDWQDKVKQAIHLLEEVLP